MNANINISGLLLKKKIAGDLSREEEKIFRDWYNSSESHRKYFENYKRQHSKIVNRGLSNVDVLAAFEDIKEKRRKNKKKAKIKKIFVRFSAAASILVVFIAGYFIYTDITSKHDDYLVKTEKVVIKPGTNKALLILGEGEQVVLDDNVDLVLQESGRKEIQVKKEGLKYSKISETSEFKKLENNELIIPAGGEYQLTLADGTWIMLNSSSKIKYPVNFSGNERRVYLEGEAFFKVKKSNKPFIVSTKFGDIKVFGTEFNVMAYEDEHEMQTTLVEGSVGVSVKGNAKSTIIKIKPGQQFAINTIDRDFKIREVDVNNYIAWKDGLFISNNESLDAIMRKLSRWFNVEVFYQNPEVKDMKFFGAMKRHENLNDILEIIEESSNVRFRIKNRTVIVSERK